MSARTVAISAGAHALVGGIVALAWRHTSPPPPTREDPIHVEIAPRAPVMTSPRDLAVLAPPTPRRIAPAPASHAAAHPSPARTSTPAPAAPPTSDAAPISGGDGAAGDGAGDGGGSGPGGSGATIDLSSRPVPIDATSARALPYTEAALRAHVSGDVVLVLHVDPQGAVTGATVRKKLGHGLDEIAIDVARRFRFRPARDPSGAATAGDVAWRFHFAPP